MGKSNDNYLTSRKKSCVPIIISNQSYPLPLFLFGSGLSGLGISTLIYHITSQSHFINKMIRVRINRIIAESIAAVSINSRESGIEIKYCPTKFIHYVRVNPQKIKSAIQHLLEQAVSLSGDSGELTVRQGKVRGKRHNDICDFTRINIKFCAQEVSVEMLTANTAMQPELRLDNCSEIFRQHGGNLWITSNDAFRFDFTFCLPLLKEIKLRSTISQKIFSAFKLSKTQHLNCY